MKNKKDIEFNEQDYDFMNSLGSAILARSPSKISRVIKIWLITIILFLAWAFFASIDEITRGDGDVVPYGQNQVIQNLEGGIIEKILVKEGAYVKKGQVILRINNAKSISTSTTNRMKYQELEAKSFRLYAEANSKKFKDIKTDDVEFKKQIRLSRELYNSNKLEYSAKDNSFREQVSQKRQAYKEAKAQVRSLKKSLAFVTQEIEMTAPMVKEGIKSRVDFLKLKRESNGIENDIEAAKLSLPRLNSAIKEIKQKRKESKQLFINTAKKELYQVTAEMARIQAQQVEYSDQVSRSMVKSPVDGIVQKLFINTVGGVIKSGDSLVEIVPTNKKLWIEVKIKPSDIAFIHPGAQAKVKISAYDYAIHGGLIGTVVDISPDTVTDSKDNTFYVIHIETAKNHLGTKEHPLQIIPGMTASIDIVTGKKTVMQYILKPILKSKQYVFSER